jgi:hypothetical protein
VRPRRDDRRLRLGSSLRETLASRLPAVSRAWSRVIWPKVPILGLRLVPSELR